ncbi:hypothetical protein ACFPA1_09835 [Neobacillus sp. GCM10023253]|uniref:hypothetical protein n=1 Tax=Neobacillus sp. GCM10023253 TaxID=3252644 RepID=UPI00361F7D7B
MDRYLEQSFDIRFLKIGIIANAGILQIGTGSAATIPKTTPVGYTTIGETVAPLLAPPSVPLQAPIRDIGKGL